MALAALGVIVNGVTALLFARGRHGDLNARAAFLHMLSDAVVAAGVVVAGGLILLTPSSVDRPGGELGRLRRDPVGELGPAARGLRPGPGRRARRRGHGRGATLLETLPGVTRLHHLHVWPMSTSETALTCHLVLPAGHPGDAFLREAADALRHRFAIGHATLQLETGAAAGCAPGAGRGGLTARRAASAPRPEVLGELEALASVVTSIGAVEAGGPLGQGFVDQSRTVWPSSSRKGVSWLRTSRTAREPWDSISSVPKPGSKKPA